MESKTSLQGFINSAGILSTIREDWNDNSPQWAQDKRHFKVQLRYSKRSMTLWFYQGTQASEPKTSTILECLLSDLSLDYYSLDEFIDELGAEIKNVADFRSNERVYKALKAQNKRFTHLISNSELISAMQEVI